MTKDEIIRMARESGGTLSSFDRWSMHTSDVERFAALVEKHAIAASMPAIKLAMQAERENGAREEREACAQIALQWDKEHPSTNFGGCIARSIRARGQHDQG
jgi:hypothetical protein